MNRLLIIMSFLLGLSLVGCSKKGESSKDSHAGHGHTTVQSYYTCSMHPQVKQDKPGKCPICHMNLTKVEIDESDMTEVQAEVKAIEKDLWQCKNFPDVTSEVADVCPMDGTPMVKKPKENKAGKVIGKVKLRKAQMSHFTPEYFPVTKMKMHKKIRLLGTILQSEDKESNIPARVGGRVEKVYVKSTGSFIKKGDPVIELYSPKLITAGEEYIIAKKSSLKSKNREFKELLKQSEQRLKLWGIKSKQFEDWYKQGEVPRSITIYSPSTGIVRMRNATVGKYFKEGQNFFELSDLSEIWVEMDVYEQDAAIVNLGQKVTLEFTSLPGEVVESVTDFVDPVINAKSRTLKIRTTIKNDTGKLKPGMIAEATLDVAFDGQPLVIPRTAVIDTGKRKVVWVKVSNKQFQAKTIRTGHESEGYVEIKHGLMEGEEVVIEGNFLLDAQAQLFGGYSD
jgi:multidrug efflux pump subunit AcrA (membrane-fusion protein)